MVTAMKFRLKTTPVDAIQWSGSNVQDISVFLAGGSQPVSSLWFNYTEADGPSFTVSLVGVGSMLTVLSGEWVVRDAEGRLSSYKPDAFAAAFDPEPA